MAFGRNKKLKCNKINCSVKPIENDHYTIATGGAVSDNGMAKVLLNGGSIQRRDAWGLNHSL